MKNFIKHFENRLYVVSAQKQLLAFGLFSIVVFVTLTANYWVNRAQLLIDQSQKQIAIALANALARGGAEALASRGSVESLKYYILFELAQTPAIDYVVYCDKHGNILLNSLNLANAKKESEIFKIYQEDPQNYSIPGVFQSPKGYRSITNIAVPMKRNQENLGICWVGLDNEAFSILGTPKETNYFLLSIFGLVAVLGVIALWANYSLINRPLSNLARGAEEIAKGNFGFQIKYQYAGKEIDSVVNAFNYMSARLQEYDKENVDILMSERNKFNSERNKLELVLMSIADGVVVLDKSNKVQIINKAACELFNQDASQMIGKPLVFCEDNHEDSAGVCVYIQKFTDSVNLSQEPINQSFNISDKTINLSSSPIILDKEFLGTVMIMHDITQQAELEKMKNEFISNVSHELRTPITSIKSYVDTLCNHGEKLETETYREFLQTIDDEANRLMFLVNDVLELSKIEESARDFELQPLDLKLAIERAVRAVNIMASDRSITLKLNQINDLPLVNINQESIERVIINLLTNAIKYTPSGGSITLESQYLDEGKEIKVSVIDTGIGIPSECLEHIFDRFYRVEKKVHTVKGTGLGLTIVKRIIEKHSGRIEVKSALGEGSTFSFYLKVLSSELNDESNQNQDLDLLESRAT